MTTRNARIDALKQALKEQPIDYVDGAMGNADSIYELKEADYRGDQLSDYNLDIKGNNDLLSITQPHIIEQIHTAYLDAGADIIETNSFNTTRIAQGDYKLEHYAWQINVAAAKVARAAADKATAITPK